MSRLKTVSASSRKSRGEKVVESCDDILAGTANPRLAASLAVLYAELCAVLRRITTQRPFDSLIAESGMSCEVCPTGLIDSALLPLQGRKTTKKKP